MTTTRTALKRLVLAGMLVQLYLPNAPKEAYAQIQIGIVRVTVTDPAAAVVSGAVATVTNKLSGYVQSAICDERGIAILNNVPFDDYQLDITVPHFNRGGLVSQGAGRAERSA